MKYEKPTLEEMELILEGSFLLASSGTTGVDQIETPEGGDEWD